jgi:hypothetical protein
MPKFVQFNAPNQSVVYVEAHQVVRIFPRLTGGGSSLNLSNGQTQDVIETMDEVLADLEGVD